MNSQLSWYDRDRSSLGQFTTGVSIHSHTSRSRESLGFVERLFSTNFFLRAFLEKQNETAKNQAGIAVDLHRAYWTPPLCPRSAFELERNQIERKLGLKSLVSLSDHDSIDAPQLLHVTMSEMPISLEWTVPFRTSKFHLGVHNLPAARATSWMDTLDACTRSRSEEQVRDMLRSLHADPDVLVIFNHPLWNLYGRPQSEFLHDLDAFLQQNNESMHAFELNGLRGWNENLRTQKLARRWQQIVISGGDRHGCEPNANLNLTNAATFAEWVREIRIERRSQILFMPQYSHSLVARCYQTFLDAIREYPGQGDGAPRWDQRTFHPGLDGQIQPLSQIWRRVPPSLDFILRTARFAESSSLLEAVRAIGGPRLAEQDT